MVNRELMKLFLIMIMCTGDIFIACFATEKILAYNKSAVYLVFLEDDISSMMCEKRTLQ